MKGSQEPRIQIEPRRIVSDGEDAALLMSAYGCALDPWQQLVLDCWLGKDEDDKYSVTSAGLSLPRQNGKNVCLEARANVMRYQLCVLWYDSGWNYAQITDDWHTRWSLSAWFAGKAYSGSAIGGPYDGVKFDCEGHYSSSTGSQSYSPFDQAGWYTFCVLAENSINVGVPDLDKTVFCCIYIPNDGQAASTYSFRADLGDDGYVYEYGTSSTKAVAGISTSAPDPSWITGPVYKLK